MAQQEIALIVGAGPGLSASLARLFKKEGMRIALAARDAKKLDDLVREVDGRAYGCDASVPKDVENLFEALSKDLGNPNVVVYNASGRVRGPLPDLDPPPASTGRAPRCRGPFIRQLRPRPRHALCGK